MPGVPKPPGDVRPDPKPSPHLPTLDKSASFKLNDGTVRTYPTLDDYVKQHVAQGDVKNLDDLIKNYKDRIGEIFFNWISTGQLACLFAVKLAKNPRENYWLPIAYTDALSDGDKLGAIISTQLDAAFDTHEAAAVILPDIVTEDQIVALVNALCSDPSGRWYHTNDGLDPDPNGAFVPIGLRWVLKTDKSVNFVLGFADLETMSLTRRSPFTALFFRIKDTKLTDEDKEDGRVQVHLADLDSTFNPQAVHDRVWEMTKAKRANYVEKEKTMGARAKVTFAVGPKAAKKLCGPKAVKVEKIGKHGK
jgi:hypothetical protein